MPDRCGILPMGVVAEVSAKHEGPLSLSLGLCHAFDLGLAERIEAVHQCHTDVDFRSLVVRIA